MELIIFTDGASRGNPGHSSYGFVIKNEAGKIIYQGSKYLGIKTNNFAEYSAVLNALAYVKDELFDKDTKLQFLMDSELVVRQLSGLYKVKSPNLKPLVEQISSLASFFQSVNYKHIPRSQNILADSLANKALDSRF